MTTLQFRRWQTFALRMAHRGLTTRSGRRLPRKSRRWVSNQVKHFFRDYLDDDYGHVDSDFVSRVESWDHTTNKPVWSGCGYDYHDHCGPYVCDLVQDLLGEGCNPHYWDEDTSRAEAWDELWGSRVRCCLRAGLDMASEPSDGVLGFDAGDLRRMYRGQVPGWITEGMVQGPWNGEGTPVDFATVPDDTGVWL